MKIDVMTLDKVRALPKMIDGKKELVWKYQIDKNVENMKKFYCHEFGSIIPCNKCINCDIINTYFNVNGVVDE